MTLLLHIIPANGGKVISKKLKKSLTEVKLPAGAHFEVVDAATGQIVHAQRAVKADTSATIDYLQDGAPRPDTVLARSYESGRGCQRRPQPRGGVAGANDPDRG